MHKYNYTYKITNIETKEFYVGVRSCDCEIEEDKYMGSSSIWTKLYIKEHKQSLKKEILEIFETRKLANEGEVLLLKSVQKDPLCINCYFDYTPDMTGVKQTPEWIEKRKMFGERNGMFGKHHTEEAKKKISEAMHKRKLTEEHKKKIGDAHRGKIVSEETRKKLSKINQKIRRIENILTGEVWIMSIQDFLEQFPEKGCKYDAMKKAANIGNIYKKTYKITDYVALTEESDNEKSGEIGESPIKENPESSLPLTKEEDVTTNS